MNLLLGGLKAKLAIVSPSVKVITKVKLWEIDFQTGILNLRLGVYLSICMGNLVFPFFLR